MTEERIWRSEIERRKTEGVELEFSPEDFLQTLRGIWPNKNLLAFLDEQEQQGHLEKLNLQQCPVKSCRQFLDEGMIQAGECPSCNLVFAESDDQPTAIVRYRIIGEPSRDIRWMIVVHGMNTRGAWQEDFSWLIANRLRYSAPILIYKYGWATVDVLSRPLQILQAKALGRRIQRAVDYARQRGLPDKPDIVAHSFGTHLITLVLKDPEFSELNFGRVITAGSIVRPDFDWTSQIRSGRVAAVLNHMGGKDKPVVAAQFMIPGTGPGARVGYLDEAVYNHFSEGFTHSEALESENLKNQLLNGGLWDRFLTSPEGQFAPDNPHSPTNWKAAPGIATAISRLLGWAILMVLGPFSWVRRKIDP